jgi:uncharacterized OsmC-like protein
MGLAGRLRNLDIAGTRCRVIKEMTSDPVRRIGSLEVLVSVPNAARLGAQDRVRLERAAQTCPVKQSLHPDIKVRIEFAYRD